MNNYNFKNLVFEGGGVKGAAYVGALSELHEMNILPNIKRVAGTSAGAIIATLLAVGYSHEEVAKIMTKMNFNDFTDKSSCVILDIVRLVRRFGWYKGDVFKNWIGTLIQDKKGNKDITFRELKEQKGSLDLYIIGTNLSEQTSVIFSYEHSPDVKVREAVRISMSIPFFFQSVQFGKDKSIMADGGMCMNYPIKIFDHKKYLEDADNEEATSNVSDDYILNNETIGFRLDSTKEIQLNQDNWRNASKSISNIKDYFNAYIGFLNEMANKRHLSDNDWKRTIFIDTLNVSFANFNISDEMIGRLVENGKDGVKKYFKWKESQS